MLAFADVLESVQAIENSVNNQAKLPTDPTVAAFGMKMNPQMLTVNLSAPSADSHLFLPNHSTRAN